MRTNLLSLALALYLVLSSSLVAAPVSPPKSVPEPSPLTLLAGPCLLGAWMFLRRRRRKT